MPTQPEDESLLERVEDVLDDAQDAAVEIGAAVRRGFSEGRDQS